MFFNGSRSVFHISGLEASMVLEAGYASGVESISLHPAKGLGADRKMARLAILVEGISGAARRCCEEVAGICGDRLHSAGDLVRVEPQVDVPDDCDHDSTFGHYHHCDTNDTPRRAGGNIDDTGGTDLCDNYGARPTRG
jgi:hypothetical protein